MCCIFLHLFQKKALYDFNQSNASIIMPNMKSNSFRKCSLYNRRMTSSISVVYGMISHESIQNHARKNITKFEVPISLGNAVSQLYPWRHQQGWYLENQYSEITSIFFLRFQTEEGILRVKHFSIQEVEKNIFELKSIFLKKSKLKLSRTENFTPTLLFFNVFSQFSA